MAIHRPTPPTPPVAPVVPGANDGGNSTNNIGNNSSQSNDGGIHIQVNLPQPQSTTVTQPAGNKTTASQSPTGDNAQGTPRDNTSTVSNPGATAQGAVGNLAAGEATETTQETATPQPLESSRNSSLPASISILLVAICMGIFGVWVFKKLHPQKAGLSQKKAKAQDQSNAGQENQLSTTGSMLASSWGSSSEANATGNKGAKSTITAEQDGVNKEKDKSKGHNFEIRI